MTAGAPRPRTGTLIEVPVCSASIRYRGSIRRIALIGNFLPRRCGIATYTTHVQEALASRYPDISTDVYAMDDGKGPYVYPRAVVATIAQDDPQSYRETAAAILRSGADLIWVQHEFGIFGGSAGEHLLSLLDDATLPVIVTLHTVSETPTPDQRRVMERLLGRATLVIVMARRAETILRRAYGGRVGPVAVVPHGIPDRGYEAPAEARRRLGRPQRPTIMTFGLLSPDKGIETMIRAMPAILAACPQAVYRIVGATHPHLLAQQGDAHREALQALARSLGVAGHLQWNDAFLEEGELLDEIAAADLYVTPYCNPAQITSGALSYAAGLGKPIVATPYVHAQELLADGRGLLVPFDNEGAMAQATVTLLQDEAMREAMAMRIRAHCRTAIWSNMVTHIVNTARALMSEGAEITEAGGEQAAIAPTPIAA